jgi:3'-phosphoadenosine 5'-phosphosulfate sulfotransferase (PAPS reductase)/FAD synthetase
MRTISDLDQINRLVQCGAMFVVNNSGGKDSQAMLLELLKAGIPKSQICNIHADLGRYDWGEESNTISAVDFAREYSFEVGLSLTVVKADKDLFQYIDRYSRWPDSRARFCTSTQKTAPIDRYIKSMGWDLVVNVMGIRAEESAKRAKGLGYDVGEECYDVDAITSTFAPCERLWRNERRFKNGRVDKKREVYSWYPIFEYTTQEVYASIVEAGQKPHPAYTQCGMSRLSCIFCVLANKQDLSIAAKTAPSLYQEYLNKEKELGKTIQIKKRKNAEDVKVPLDEWLATPSKKRKGIMTWEEFEQIS